MGTIIWFTSQIQKRHFNRLIISRYDVGEKVKVVYFRSKKADCSLNIKGCKVNISYQNKGGSRRHIYLDKNEVSGEFISFDNTYLMNHEKVEISIIDE